MATRKKSASTNVDALLEELIVDACGDDEQLTALREAIAEALDLPVDVHVVGEPLSLIGLDYDGTPRRGLVARCRREDGSEYRVAFADVQLSPDVTGYPYLAAYCRWLGIEPVPIKGPHANTKAQRHKVSQDDIDLSKSVDLAVWAVKERAARCRLLGSDRVITLRAGSLHSLVPGQVVTVQPTKHWRHNGHPYLSGKIASARVDAAALGLMPLALNEFGSWDPAQEYWGEEGEPIEAWARPIIARGPRPMFEIERVLPGADPDEFDSDPILEAMELKEAGDAAGARDILDGMLEADLRALDAHAHLGNLLFPHAPGWAINHYEVGARIGELSLGDGFDGVLAWGLIDNRPFLRCMQGYALSLWRLERWEEAEHLFSRMLWLNPSDNQGIRFVLPDVQAREPWVDDDE